MLDLNAVQSAPPIVPSTPRRPPTIMAGWVCFALGMLFMLFSLATFFLYGPLFLASLVLSIVALAQRRVPAGVVLLVFTLAVPPVFWLARLAVGIGTALVDNQVQKQAALSKVEFEDVSGRRDGDYMYLEGKVRNTGTKTVSFVKVAVEWLDASGTVLDTDYTYAVGADTLRPGGAKSFSIMTRADSRMSKFRYFVVNE
jgi:hypothetical protein